MQEINSYSISFSSIRSFCHEKSLIFQGLLNRRNVIWTIVLCTFFTPLLGLVLLNFLVKFLGKKPDEKLDHGLLPENQRKKVLIAAGSNSLPGKISYTHFFIQKKFENFFRKSRSASS